MSGARVPFLADPPDKPISDRSHLDLPPTPSHAPPSNPQLQFSLSPRALDPLVPSPLLSSPAALPSSFCPIRPSSGPLDERRNSPGVPAPLPRHPRHEPPTFTGILSPIACHSYHNTLASPIAYVRPGSLLTTPISSPPLTPYARSTCRCLSRPEATVLPIYASTLERKTLLTMSKHNGQRRPAARPLRAP